MHRITLVVCNLFTFGLLWVREWRCCMVHEISTSSVNGHFNVHCLPPDPQSPFSMSFINISLLAYVSHTPTITRIPTGNNHCSCYIAQSNIGWWMCQNWSAHPEAMYWQRSIRPLLSATKHPVSDVLATHKKSSFTFHASQTFTQDTSRYTDNF